jgi:2-methylcitrate dehydratase PrpD
MDMARRCLVDWVASATAGLATTEALRVDTYVSGWRSHGHAMTLFGKATAPPCAALVNGTIAHLLDYDDLNLAAAFHPGAPTFAAALAVAMDCGASETDLLRAFVVGYEVGAAFGADGVGLALVERGWHPTAILGHLSATAACAYLLDLDDVGIGNAFGLAATQAGGLLAAGGSTAKPFQIGKAAMNGLMAAEAAKAGIDGPADLLDDTRPGLFQALLGKTKPAEGLGEQWRISDTSFKPYPSCQFTHAPFEAAQRLSQHASGQVEQIRVFANPVAIKVAGHVHPHTVTQARFSIAYSAALGLTGHAASPTDFSDDRLADSNIRRLLGIVELVPDATVERWSSRLELKLTDGETHTATVIDPLGSAGRPMGWTELKAKFVGAARPVLRERTDLLLSQLADYGNHDSPAWEAGAWFRRAFGDMNT